MHFVTDALQHEFAELRGKMRVDLREELRPLLAARDLRPPIRACSSTTDGPGPPLLSEYISLEQLPGAPQSMHVPQLGRGTRSELGPQPFIPRIRRSCNPATASAPVVKRTSEMPASAVVHRFTQVVERSSRHKPSKQIPRSQRTDESSESSSTTSLGRTDPVYAWRATDELGSGDALQSEEPPTTCFKLLSRFVMGLQFDYVSGVLVALNALAVGIQTDWQAQHVASEVPQLFRIVEIIFCVLFALELALRVLVYGRSFFAKQHFKWHLFDCLLVGLQVGEEVLSAILNTRSAAGARFGELRILRILRLIRVMRLVRILRLIAELRTLVMSIWGSLKPLVWAVCLLFLVIYAVSIYITQTVLEYRLDDSFDASNQDSKAIIERFGSLGDTVLSVYMSVTGGVNYEDLVLPLKAQVGVYLAPMYMLYIAFVLMCMLNVITGVFVETALLTAKEDKDNYMVSSARLLFETFDANRSGKMSRKEFSQAVQSQEMKRVLAELDIAVTEADLLFDVLDTEGIGRINAEDFISGCVRLRGPAKALELAILSRNSVEQMQNLGLCLQLVQCKLELLCSSVAQVPPCPKPPEAPHQRVHTPVHPRHWEFAEMEV